MLMVDLTVVQVALPTIQHHLRASFTDLQWVIDAARLPPRPPPAGRAAIGHDRRGRLTTLVQPPPSPVKRARRPVDNVASYSQPEEFAMARPFGHAAP
jgi:hypothetical protein